MFWQQRLEAVQRVLRLLELRARALNASLGGLDSELQLFVLRAPYFDLLIESGKRRFRFIERLLVIVRVDLEKQIALLSPAWLSCTVSLTIWPRHARHNSHDVGARGRIIGSWMSFQYTPDIKR